MRRFLEMDGNFTFIGNQYRLKPEQTEYFKRKTNRCSVKDSLSFCS
jgi:hypothetical protein